MTPPRHFTVFPANQDSPKVKSGNNVTCQTPVGLLHLSQQHPLLTGPHPVWQGPWFPGGFAPCGLAQLLSSTSMTLALGRSSPQAGSPVDCFSVSAAQVSSVKSQVLHVWQACHHGDMHSPSFSESPFRHLEISRASGFSAKVYFYPGLCCLSLEKLWAAPLGVLQPW